MEPGSLIPSNGQTRELQAVPMEIAQIAPTIYPPVMPAQESVLRE